MTQNILSAIFSTITYTNQSIRKRLLCSRYRDRSVAPTYLAPAFTSLPNFIISTQDAYDDAPKPRTNRPIALLEHYNSFIVKNAKHIWRATEISDTGAGRATIELKRKSKNVPGKVFMLERIGYDPIYILNGSQIAFYSKNVHEIDGELSATTFLTNIWTDIAWEGIAGEGGVTFKKGKKPEKLIRRCLDLASNADDWVLDSFLGSGTTTAVAHKMRRKWIGIELGEHANSHCLPRLKSVVDGTDQSGVSKSLEWKGGGGFKFYNLAPSLLKKDNHDNWVIDKKYNADMLAAAMSKQEGFHFSPDEQIFWKQGRSTEKDFLFTTTQFVTTEMLDTIHDEMQPEESLLIACKAFHDDCAGKYPNITIKKIPQILLGRCEFGKDDYSLNIINTPEVDSGDAQEEPVTAPAKAKGKQKARKKK